MVNRSRWRQSVMGALLLIGIALVPVVAHAVGQPYYITLFNRILILALAAVGLNLILGYGGLVSFGHSLYIGLGAYSVGILASHSVFSGPLQLIVALVLGAVFAILIGLICLRTSGMAFIMITLAFTQMAYFLTLGLKAYGGDDGMPLAVRSQFAFVDLASNTVLYYAIFGVLLVVLFFMSRLVNSRFGMVLRACNTNERRMLTLGYTPLLYRLTAYVISAEICVIAGFFLANLTNFTSPSYLQWTLSGELIVMVVLGGIGTVLGPVVGALALILLEEVLGNFKLGLPWNLDSLISSHLMAFVGAFILVVALYFRDGLYGFFAVRRRH
jgi:branched-chain amino acid transport system permease protein